MIRPRGWLPFVLLALALAELAGASVVGLLTPASVPPEHRAQGAGALLVGACLGFAVIGTLVAQRQPGNRVGWMMLGIGVCLPLGISNQYVIDWYYAPRSFPDPWLAGLLGNAGWFAALALLLTCFLYFPDGTALSPRWRWFGRAAAAAISLGLVAQSLDPRGLDNGPARVPNPIGIRGASAVMQGLFLVSVGTLLCVLVAGLVSQVLRYRRGGVELRQQLKLVLLAIALLIATTLFAFLEPISSAPDRLVSAVYGLGYLAVPVAIGVAILRYRLFDVDLVISRALVYAALAGFITLVYVGIVVGLGALLGAGRRPNLGLSILATAVVAVAFQPLRERLTRLANRVVYGPRATPYEVLAQFSRGLGSTYAHGEALERLAQVVADATVAESAAVILGDTRVAVHPPGANGAGAEHLVEVRHQGERVGALSVRKHRGEALSPHEERLLADLANQAGLMLHNVLLDRQLLERLEELRASRQRLVRAQDDERRRLERNLHDGAQQHLVALKVRLGLARALGSGDRDRLVALLGELQSEVDATLETMRELARGIYPPLLAERGLKAALEAQARRAVVPVSIEAEDGRYAQEVEAAVYFCVLEALQNVQKYAGPSRAVVRLCVRDGRLRFEVRDDGRGFDPTAASGSGLTNMRDRLDALGGTLTVESQLGAGTTVAGAVPL